MSDKTPYHLTPSTAPIIPLPLPFAYPSTVKKAMQAFKVECTKILDFNDPAVRSIYGAKENRDAENLDLLNKMQVALAISVAAHSSKH